ncbi:MAG: winged helix-turn-helix domain-containing protein [Actinomycetota bacterium]
MSDADAHPDHALDELRVVTEPEVVRAMFDPVRSAILDLLLERAATVTELAVALDRPKSTIAHHIGVLADAGLVRVVRTRRVRAIEERFFGRTARHFQVGEVAPEVVAEMTNDLAVAAAESREAHARDELRAALRHVRLSPDDAAELWARALELVRDAGARPRSGTTSYGLVVGLYPFDAPALPPRADG